MSGQAEGHRAGWRPRLEIGAGSLPSGGSTSSPLSPTRGGGADRRTWCLSRLPFWPACSQNPGTAFVAFLAWATMALLAACWGMAYYDDLAYPRTGSSALTTRLWTLILTFTSGLSVPFLVMAVLVAVYYRIARPLSFIIAGLIVSLLANLVSLVMNVVVHLTANEKMRYVCYRSGISDSTCAYNIADEIYCGTSLQDLCTVFLLGFDGMICCLGGMLIILACMIGHAYKQRKKMQQVSRTQEADFDFVLHVNA